MITEEATCRRITMGGHWRITWTCRHWTHTRRRSRTIRFRRALRRGRSTESSRRRRSGRGKCTTFWRTSTRWSTWRREDITKGIVCFDTLLIPSSTNTFSRASSNSWDVDMNKGTPEKGQSADLRVGVMDRPGKWETESSVHRGTCKCSSASRELQERIFTRRESFLPLTI